MALPTTIVSNVGLAGHHPPEISSAENFYSIVRADVDELDAHKATDPEDSWTVQGTGPVHVGTILGFSSIKDGDILHIVAWSSATYEYYTFNMATDAWVIDELIETPKDAPAFPWASISVRSDGDIIVAYAGDTDKVMGDRKERIDYARREGGSWTTGVALDAGGDVHYGNPNLVKSATTDDMHFFWQKADLTTNDPPVEWTSGQAITLDPSNTLSIVQTNNFLDTNFALLGKSNAVSYLDGSTTRMFWINISDDSVNTTSEVFIAFEDGSDDISTLTGAVVSNQGAFKNGEVGIITMADLSNDLHVLFSGGGVRGVDQDLYYSKGTSNGSSWAAATEEIDAITVNFISTNIYVRCKDTVLAYVYDDGGVQKYNEKILIVGQTHQMMI